MAHSLSYSTSILDTFSILASFSPAGVIWDKYEKYAIPKIEDATLKIRGSLFYLKDLTPKQAEKELKSLDKINQHKARLAKLYFENLKDDFVLPIEQDDYRDVFHIFNIRHKKRDLLKSFLLEHDIKTEIHYPVAPHKQKALSFLGGMEFPLSEQIHNTTLSLPISYFHNENDIFRVVEVLNSFK